MMLDAGAGVLVTVGWMYPTVTGAQSRSGEGTFTIGKGECCLGSRGVVDGTFCTQRRTGDEKSGFWRCIAEMRSKERTVDLMGKCCFSSPSLTIHTFSRCKLLTRNGAGWIDAVLSAGRVSGSGVMIKIGYEQYSAFGVRQSAQIGPYACTNLACSV